MWSPTTPPTVFGRYIFAVDGNVNAAIASGVSEFKTKVGVYTVSGLLAGIAAIIFTAKTGSAQSNIGIGYETDAVAACVLGGTSFAGGIAMLYEHKNNAGANRSGWSKYIYSKR